jgi:hypothetical protein
MLRSKKGANCQHQGMEIISPEKERLPLSGLQGDLPPIEQPYWRNGLMSE